jgi:hypothetical protein
VYRSRSLRTRSPVASARPVTDFVTGRRILKPRGPPRPPGSVTWVTARALSPRPAPNELIRSFGRISHACLTSGEPLRFFCLLSPPRTGLFLRVRSEPRSSSPLLLSCPGGGGRRAGNRGRIQRALHLLGQGPGERRTGSLAGHGGLHVPGPKAARREGEELSGHAKTSGIPCAWRKGA